MKPRYRSQPPPPTPYPLTVEEVRAVPDRLGTVDVDALKPYLEDVKLDAAAPPVPVHAFDLNASLAGLGRRLFRRRR